MKEFKIKVTTEFKWHRDSHEDIPEEHVQELADHAYDRISQMVSDGYVEGELSTSIGDDGSEIGYSGWWTWKKEDK